MPGCIGTHHHINRYENIGTSGGMSMFKPYVQSGNDFSLLQTAEGRNNPQGQIQTVEAGWQNYPNLNNDVALFTFFNTNGYTAGGNNLGGYNQQVQGWVQYDQTVFPGTKFSTHSAIGGTQYTLGIEYLLSGGNWWLSVNGAWIGYYPALFIRRHKQLSSRRRRSMFLVRSSSLPLTDKS